MSSGVKNCLDLMKKSNVRNYINLYKYFDYKFYLNKYSELQSAGIKSKDDAFKHFMTIGLLEDKICHPSEEHFDWKFYINYHTDLSMKFKSFSDAVMHWRNYGYKEGRVCYSNLSTLIQDKADEPIEDKNISLERTIKQLKAINQTVIINENYKNDVLKTHLEITPETPEDDNITDDNVSVNKPENVIESPNNLNTDNNSQLEKEIDNTVKKQIDDMLENVVNKPEKKLENKSEKKVEKKITFNETSLVKNSLNNIDDHLKPNKINNMDKQAIMKTNKSLPANKLIYTSTIKKSTKEDTPVKINKHIVKPAQLSEASQKFNNNMKNISAVIYLPPGIGDAVWSLTKVQDIAKKHGYKKIYVCVKDTDLNRSQEFLKRFTFVTDVIYETFHIHPPGEPEIHKDGTYNYIKNVIERNDYDKVHKYYIICNNYLERGVRLENWLPEYETNFSVADTWAFKTCDIQYLKSTMKVINAPYCVFYIGPLLGNTVDGHNKENLWSVHDWIKLGEYSRNKFGLHIIIVGAPYDKSYARLFYEYLTDEQKEYYSDVVGKTGVGDLYAICKCSKFVISYQSGVGIFSVYMKVPAAIWWRPHGDSLSTYPHYYISFYNEMAGAWAPPNMLEEGLYTPLHYTKVTPEGIFDNIVKYDWVNKCPAKNINSYEDLLTNLDELFPNVIEQDESTDRPKIDSELGNRSCGASGNTSLGVASNNREFNAIKRIEKFRELEKIHNFELSLQTICKLLIMIEVAECQGKSAVFNMDTIISMVENKYENPKKSGADIAIVDSIRKKYDMDDKYRINK